MGIRVGIDTCWQRKDKRCEMDSLSTRAIRLHKTLPNFISRKWPTEDNFLIYRDNQGIPGGSQEGNSGEVMNNQLMMMMNRCPDWERDWDFVKEQGQYVGNTGGKICLNQSCCLPTPEKTGGEQITVEEWSVLRTGSIAGSEIMPVCRLSSPPRQQTEPTMPKEQVFTFTIMLSVVGLLTPS